MFVNRMPQYFLTTARERNVTRAAEKLFISQSSLSQHLAKLEAELGCTLFDRSRSPLELTEAGMLYKKYLENTLYTYQRFEAELSDLAASKAQTVSIGVGNWRGSILIPEILPSFLENHENVLVNLNEFPVSELIPKLQSGSIDFAVMNIAVDNVPRDLACDVIGYERVLIAARGDLPLAQALLAASESGAGILPETMAKERLLSLSSRLTIGSTVENFLEVTRIAPSSRINSTNNRTLLRLCAEGMGYSFMVESGIGESVFYPAVRFFDLQMPELSVPLVFLYQKNSYLSPVAEALMEEVRSYYLALFKENRASEKIRSAGLLFS